jgi:hypothetical protein
MFDTNDNDVFWDGNSQFVIQTVPNFNDQIICFWPANEGEVT